MSVVQCPGCMARLNAPDAAAGKKLKCPRCGAPVSVPAAPAAFEVVDDPEEVEPAAPAPRTKPSRAAVQDPDEDPPRPRARRKSRPEADDNNDEDRPRKSGGKGPLFAALGAGVLMLLLVGGGLAYWLTHTKAPDTNGSVNSGETSDGGANGGAAAVVPAAGLKEVAPRLKFTANLKKKAGDKNEPRGLLVTADGARVVVTSNRQTQVWAAGTDAKPLCTVDGQATGISDDGALLTGFLLPREVVELDTGSPSNRAFVGVTFDGINGSLATPTEQFNWSRSTDWRAAQPLRISRAERPAQKSQPLDGGDDNRIDFVSPIKGGKELVYGLPKAGKVRVFDFAAKSVVREFALANPREYKGTPGGQTWGVFRVSPDGKWVAAVRTTLGHDPDPLEVFDATGAVVATVPGRVLSDLSGTFVAGRDVYVAPFNGAKGMSYTSTRDLLVYDIRKQALAAVLRGHGAYVSHLAPSADGKVLATADSSGEVCIWDLSQLP